MSTTPAYVVRYTTDRGLAHIEIDNPPVNALSHPVRKELMACLERAEQDSVRALLLGCAGSSFIAGADIKEIGQAPQAPLLPDVIRKLDESPVPIVALMHGNALGGGLEIALACHYRLARQGTQFGLPEVKLGIIPGAGGTQRLPRLIGVTAALDMISSGRAISAERALHLGLIDAVLDDDLNAAGRAWFATHVGESEEHPRLSTISVDANVQDLEALAAQRKKAARRPQVLAPRALCDALEAAFTQPFITGVATERALFNKCRDSPQSAAFRHLFFAERAAAKSPAIKTVVVDDIASTAVVGGGTMGRGIALNLLDAGLPVTLLDVSEDSVAQAREAIHAHFASSVQRGRMSQAQSDERRKRIRFATDYNALSDVDLVIEAVFEDMQVKRDVFARLDQACKPDTILASNTSYQDINALARVTDRPSSVLGMHYFSPATVMKLLEVVRAEATSPQVLAKAVRLGKACGKLPVIAGVCYGFIGNRINRRLQQQAQLCLLEGATPASIDRAMEDFGMAMGPLAVGDLAGLDVGYSARKGLSTAQKGDPRTYCIPDRLVEAGRLGQKNQQGYYRYEKGSRARAEDPFVLETIQRVAAQFGYDTERSLGAPSDEEIVERLLLAVVNEAIRVLDEGVAAQASDIDVVYVHGYGFPAHRGGVMYWADTLGVTAVRDKLMHYADVTGDNQLRPAPLLNKLAATGGNFLGRA